MLCAFRMTWIDPEDVNEYVAYWHCHVETMPDPYMWVGEFEEMVA